MWTSTMRPSAPAAAGSLSPEIVATLSNMAALQRLWAGVLASLKKSKAAYGVLFMNTKAVFDAAAGALLIEFPAENDFAFRAVQKPTCRPSSPRPCAEKPTGTFPSSCARAAPRLRWPLPPPRLPHLTHPHR